MEPTQPKIYDDGAHVYVMVSRTAFESWLDLVEGDAYCTPDYHTASIRVSIDLGDGRTAWLNAMGMLVTDQGTRYGRGDGWGNGPTGWNAVRVNKYWGTAFNLSGKGCRSTETSHQVAGLLEQLTGFDATI